MSPEPNSKGGEIMSKISKFSLKPRVRKRLISNLWQVTAKLKTEPEAKKFLGNILTPAEQEMLAKRIEALKLLEKKKTYSEIGRALNMSSPTLSRLNNRLRADKNFKERVKSLT